MNVQQNPFLYGRPVSQETELVDRAQELRELETQARSGQSTMLYAPRRYGKTSLAHVLSARLLAQSAIPSVYVDLWGATSITDIAALLARGYAAVSGVERMKRYLMDVLQTVGVTISVGGAVSITRSLRDREGEDRAVLRELLTVPRQIASRSPSGKLLLVLDEFGELFHIPGEPDALMRSAFQSSPEVSFLFMGSKRSLMDALFTDRNRPFYNFGRRMELGRLPYEELGAFIERGFREGGRDIMPEAVDLILSLSEGHPFRSQQLSFHAFRLAGVGMVDDEVVLTAAEAALDETEAEFRAILEGMTPARRAVYLAVCREPTAEMHSREYMRRHGIKGSGSLDSALQALADSGDLEVRRGAVPKLTDPLLGIWVRQRLGA